MPSISTEDLLAKLKGLPQFHIPNMIPAQTTSNAGAAVADMGEQMAAPKTDAVPKDSGDTQALVQQLKGLLNPPPPSAGQAALGAMAQFSRAGFQDPLKAQEEENQRTALNQQNLSNRARMVMEQLQNQRQQEFQQGEVARQNRALDIQQQANAFTQGLAKQKFPYEMQQLQAATTKEQGEAAKSGLITVGDNVYRVNDLLNGEHPEALQPLNGNMAQISPELAQSIGQPDWAGKKVSLKILKDATETASSARKTNTTGEGVIEQNLITGQKQNLGTSPTVTSIIMQNQAEKGNQPAVANVAPKQVPSALAAAKKAGDDFIQTQQAADDVNSFIQSARSGNKVAYAYAPVEGVLTLNSERGTTRVNVSELGSYAGAGSLADNIKAKFGKLGSGASIPPDLLNDMEALHNAVLKNAGKAYQRQLDLINQTYGASFQPLNSSGQGGDMTDKRKKYNY